MTNDEIGKKIGFLMHYFLDWWTVWQQDNTDADIDAAYVKETDGGIRFGIQEDGTAIFPTARPSAKKELPAEPERGANRIVDSETNTRAETPFYSKEEIESMPRLKDGHFRITPDGYHQVRYRRDGYDIQFTSKDLKTVKKKFCEWAKSVRDERKAAQLPKKSQIFSDFAERYFASVKIANVEKCTYDTQHRALELHILPKIGNMTFRQITPLTCQEVLNGLLSEGKGRTAEMVKCIRTS